MRNRALCSMGSGNEPTDAPNYPAASRVFLSSALSFTFAVTVWAVVPGHHVAQTPAN